MIKSQRSHSCGSVAPRREHAPQMPVKQPALLTIGFHRANLFSSNLRLKGPTSDQQFCLTFAGAASASLRARDSAHVLAQLDCKRLLSETYTITAGRRCELVFPSICQLDYPLSIGDRVYSWRPPLISPSWVLVDLHRPSLPLAKFKRRILDHRLGRLLVFVDLPAALLHPLLVALGFILHRHRWPHH